LAPLLLLPLLLVLGGILAVCWGVRPGLCGGCCCCRQQWTVLHGYVFCLGIEQLHYLQQQGYTAVFNRI
jgi:hypothetical protein